MALIARSKEIDMQVTKVTNSSEREKWGPGWNEGQEVNVINWGTLA